MKWHEVPLHGSIFVALFMGFSRHGGFAGATWSEQRLRSVFAALIDALEGGVRGLSVEVWLAVWALRAFKRCASAEETREVYAVLREYMVLDESQDGFMEDFLTDLLHGRDRSDNARGRAWVNRLPRRPRFS
jgi:hypothetical protein